MGQLQSRALLWHAHPVSAGVAGRLPVYSCCCCCAAVAAYAGLLATASLSVSCWLLSTAAGRRGRC